MQPLVLAIEPDLRQAAIVKRIVREKVLADVAVVDSRDAALEAMRTSVPDVLLLSALLSPRDEDELIAHLRTLEHAQHLQTHTIPQLASSIGPEDDKPSGGLFSAFRRRKAPAGAAPAGCDPDLFADEIRTYLQRAKDKKKELRESGTRPPVPAVATSAAAAAAARREEAEEAPAPASSWASPFEWRPSRSTTPRSAEPEAAKAPAPPVPEPAPAVHEELFFTAPEPAPTEVLEPVAAAAIEPAAAEPEPAVLEPAAAAALEAFVVAAPEPLIVAPPESVILRQVEPVVVRPPEPAIVLPAPEPEPLVIARAPRQKLPLVKRHAREWWFEDREPQPRPTKTDSEMREVLQSLSVPFAIAAIAYSGGCRIRRVRLNAS
jgi:hypothetical protein